MTPEQLADTREDMAGVKIPVSDFLRFLERAVQHYERSAPPVSRYLDDLYVRLCENIDAVLLVEMTAAARLLEGGQWEHPNHAANRFYKLAHRLGRDTTGLTGF